MIATCPNCETRFNVPDAALGSRGRTVRCARCGHKWKQTPEEAAPAFSIGGGADDFMDEMAAKATRPAPMMAMDPPDDDMGDFKVDDLLEAVAAANTSLPPKPAADEDAFGNIAEMMMQSAPEPIPEVFASPPARPGMRRASAAGIWILVVALILAATGAGLYYFRDRVIDIWPGASRFYEKLGIHNQVIGFGLSFRDYKSERQVQDGAEVLVVQGVIANNTAQKREIPLLSLALYNNQAKLQEKIISPPQSTLDPKANVAFRITLDQPDPHASRFEVTFAAPKPDAKPAMDQPAAADQSATGANATAPALAPAVAPPSAVPAPTAPVAPPAARPTPAPAKH